MMHSARGRAAAGQGGFDGRGRGPLRAARAPIALALAALGFGSSAWALPDGANVAAGAASVSTPSAQTMVIDQASQRAVIDWQRFSIDSAETVRFNQPSSSAAVLNRVLGNDPSHIYGRLEANGQVFLVNPFGVHFSRTASVDVGSLVASTLQIGNEDFMAGRLRFEGDGSEAAVSNAGRLSARPGGTIALIGPQVSNTGTIEAPQGSALMGAGSRVTVDFYGDGLTLMRVDSEAARARLEQSGTVSADGGRVDLQVRAQNAMVDTVLNVDGIVRARTIEQRDGAIYLGGGPRGRVEVSGTLDASGATEGSRGGTVHVLGDEVRVTGAASIDASGPAGGGTVLVGGPRQGAGPEQQSSSTTLEPGATVAADATTFGDGGSVVVWSAGGTETAAALSARGGPQGGDGGFVETSGKTLSIKGSKIDTSAPQGDAGAWLIDPDDFEVGPDEAAIIVSTLESGSTAFITAIQDVRVNAPIRPEVPYFGATLDIEAGRDVDISAEIGPAGIDLATTDSPYGSEGAALDVYINADTGSVRFHDNVVAGYLVVDANWNIEQDGGRIVADYGDFLTRGGGPPSSSFDLSTISLNQPGNLFAFGPYIGQFDCCGGGSVVFRTDLSLTNAAPEASLPYLYGATDENEGGIIPLGPGSFRGNFVDINLSSSDAWVDIAELFDSAGNTLIENLIVRSGAPIGASTSFLVGADTLTVPGILTLRSTAVAAGSIETNLVAGDTFRMDGQYLLDRPDMLLQSTESGVVLGASSSLNPSGFASSGDVTVTGGLSAAIFDGATLSANTVTMSGDVNGGGVFTGATVSGTNGVVIEGTGPSSNVTVEGTVSSPSGSVALTAGQYVSIGGTVEGDTGVVATSGGDLYVDGTVASASGSVSLANTGSYLIVQGSYVAGTVSGRDGVSVSANGQALIFGEIGSAQGSVDIGSTGLTDVSGSIDAPAGSVSVSAGSSLNLCDCGEIAGSSVMLEAGTDFTIAGAVSALGLVDILGGGTGIVSGIIEGQSVFIESTGVGDVSVSGDVLGLDTLSLIAGAAPGSAGSVSVTGNLTVFGDLALQGSEGVTLGGSTLAGSTQVVSGAAATVGNADVVDLNISAAGDVLFTGVIAAETLAVQAGLGGFTGDVIQTDGSLSTTGTSSFASSAPGPVFDLRQAGNAFAAFGGLVSFSAPAGLASDVYYRNESFNALFPSFSAGFAFGDLTVQLPGSVVDVGAGLNLAVGGDLDLETGASITVGTPVNGIGAVRLASSLGQVSVNAPVTAAGGLTLEAGADVLLGANVTAPALSVVAGTAGSTGDIVQSGGSIATTGGSAFETRVAGGSFALGASGNQLASVAGAVSLAAPAGVASNVLLRNESSNAQFPSLSSGFVFGDLALEFPNTGSVSVGQLLVDALTIVSGGDVLFTADVDASTLSVLAGAGGGSGDILQTGGRILATGASSFELGAAGQVVDLRLPGNTFATSSGTVGIAAPAGAPTDVYLRNEAVSAGIPLFGSSLSLGDLTLQLPNSTLDVGSALSSGLAVGGDLDLETGTSITLGTPVNGNGAVRLATSQGDLTVNATLSSSGALTLEAGGDVRLNSDIDAQTLSIVAGTAGATGDIVQGGSGRIATTGASAFETRVGGASMLIGSTTGNLLAIDGGGVSFTAPAGIATDVTLRNDAADPAFPVFSSGFVLDGFGLSYPNATALTIGDLQAQSASIAVGGDVFLAGDLTLGSLIVRAAWDSASGSIVQTGGTVVTSGLTSLSVDAPGQAIDLRQPGNALATSAGSVIVRGPAGGLTDVHLRNEASNAAIPEFSTVFVLGDLPIGDLTLLLPNSTVDVGAALAAGLTAAGSLDLETGAAITLGTPVNGGGDVRLASTQGQVSLNAPVSAAGGLALEAAGDVLLGANLDAQTLSIRAGTAETLGAIVQSAGRIATSGTTGFETGAPGGDFALGAAGNQLAASGGTVSFAAPAGVPSDVLLRNEAANASFPAFSSGFAFGSLTVEHPNSDVIVSGAFPGGIFVPGGLDLSAGGDILLGSAQTAGLVALSGGRDVTIQGPLSGSGDLTVSAGRNAIVAATTEMQGDVSLAAQQDVDVRSPLIARDALSLDAGRDILTSGSGGTIGETAITFAAGDTIRLGRSPVSGGPVAFGAPVLLTAPSSVNGSTVSFAGTIDGAHALTVIANGMASFAGSIGQSTALQSLNVLAPNIALGSGQAFAVSTTGSQSYDGTIATGPLSVVAGGGVEATNGGNVFGGALSLALSGGSSTVISSQAITLGNVSLSGGATLEVVSVASGTPIVQQRASNPITVNTSTVTQSGTITTAGGTSLVVQAILGSVDLGNTANNIGGLVSVFANADTTDQQITLASLPGLQVGSQGIDADYVTLITSGLSTTSGGSIVASSGFIAGTDPATQVPSLRLIIPSTPVPGAFGSLPPGDPILVELGDPNQGLTGIVDITGAGASASNEVVLSGSGALVPVYSRALDPSSPSVVYNEAPLTGCRVDCEVVEPQVYTVLPSLITSETIPAEAFPTESSIDLILYGGLSDFLVRDVAVSEFRGSRKPERCATSAGSEGLRCDETREAPASVERELRRETIDAPGPGRPAIDESGGGRAPGQQ